MDDLKRYLILIIFILSACGGSSGGGSGSDDSDDDEVNPPVAPAGLATVYFGNFFGIDLDTGNSSFSGGLGLKGVADVRAMAYDSTENILYAADVSSGLLFQLDVASGDASVIGPTSSTVASLAYDPNSDTLYGTLLVEDLLVRIDTQTAKSTLVGAIGPIGTINMLGMAFDPNSSILYAVDAQSNTLVTLDQSSGAVTTIGATTHSNIQALTYDENTDTLYGASDTSGLVRIDTATASSTIVGPMGSVTGLAFNSNNNALYGATFFSSELISIDQSNAAITSRVHLGGKSMRGLTYSEANQRLYGIDNDETGSADRLFSINVMTGRATIIGSTGFADVQSLAMDPNSNTIYGLNNSTNELLIIDSSTGTATAVGNTGIVGLHASLAFNSSNNLLYAVDQISGNVVSIDPVTGSGSLVAGLTLSGFDISGLVYSASDDLFYAIDRISEELISIDIVAKTFTVIGTTAIAEVTGIAFDSANNRLLVSNTDQLHLYSVDPQSAEATTVGAIGHFFTRGVAHDSSSDTIYVSATDSKGGLLLKIDRTTGSGTLIGRIGFGNVNSLTYDPDSDTLFGFDLTANRLLSIDTASGVGTMVADLDVFAGLSFGIDFNPAESILYGIGGSGELLSIDRTTAMSTSLGFSSSPVFSPVFDVSTDQLYATNNDEANHRRELLVIDTLDLSQSPVAQLNTAYEDFVFIP